jgi:hypothetical protein
MGIVELIPQDALRAPGCARRAPRQLRHLLAREVYLPIMGSVRCMIAMADR